MGGGTPSEPAVPSPTPPPTANNAASLAVEQATKTAVAQSKARALLEAVGR